MPAETALTRAFITPEALLAHYQGHRRVTRRMIEAYPEGELFTFTLGGMRPFGAMVLELLAMGAPTVKGLATGEWDAYSPKEQATKAELLEWWDLSTQQIDAQWPTIPVERFQETVTAFGMYTAPAHDIMLYVIDNEIHHRGQGYVYLRALGVEPPPFYVRD